MNPIRIITLMLAAAALSLSASDYFKPEPGITNLWSTTDSVIKNFPPSWVTLEFPASRHYIRVGSTYLFKFTDEEWAILLKTFSEDVVTNGTNLVSFSGTNQWSKDHQWKDRTNNTSLRRQPHGAGKL